MGAPGRPEKKSERKAEAARRNARLPRPGGRKIPLDAERIVAETLDRLRALGPTCAEFLEKTMADPRAPTMAKVVIAREIFDRAGWPRKNETTIDVGVKAVGRKLIEFAHSYEAPRGWNGSELEREEAARTPWMFPDRALPPARARVEAPSPPVVAADVPGLRTPPPLPVREPATSSATPTPHAAADDVPGSSGALEVVDEAELQRRQAERDARELERLTADDTSTRHLMERQARGWDRWGWDR